MRPVTAARRLAAGLYRCEPDLLLLRTFAGEFCRIRIGPYVAPIHRNGPNDLAFSDERSGRLPWCSTNLNWPQATHWRRSPEHHTKPQPISHSSSTIMTGRVCAHPSLFHLRPPATEGTTRRSMKDTSGARLGRNTFLDTKILCVTPSRQMPRPAPPSRSAETGEPPAPAPKPKNA